MKSSYLLKKNPSIMTLMFKKLFFMLGSIYYLFNVMPDYSLCLMYWAPKKHLKYAFIFYLFNIKRRYKLQKCLKLVRKCYF